jgi:hypothetical protein
VFLSVVVLVIGAVTAFAIYTWGWREDGEPSAADAATARTTSAAAAKRRTRMRAVNFDALIPRDAADSER